MNRESSTTTAAVALTTALTTSGVGLFAPIVEAAVPAVTRTAEMPAIDFPIPVPAPAEPAPAPAVVKNVAAVTKPAPPVGGLAGKLDSMSSKGWGLKPRAARVAHLVQDRFGVKTIYGYRPNAIDKSGHPSGLAVDFMVNRQTGDQVAAFLLANRDVLGVKYVIWRQRLNFGTGWRGMSDRGGITANHYDHVHVTFR